MRTIAINNKIIRAGSMSLLATVITRAVNLISVPIFSRLLTTEEYGRVDVFMTYMNVFVIVSGLDFHGAVGKGRLDYKEDADGYVTSSVLFTTINVVCIAVIINVLYSILGAVIGMEQYLFNIMLLYSYAIFLMTYRSAEYNFYFEYKNNLLMSVSVALGNLLLSVLFIKTFFSGSRMLGRVLGATIPTAVCAVIIWFYYGNRGKWSFRWEYIKYSLKFGVPLIPHNLSHIVLAGSDKIMIQNMIGASESGIYSLSYTLGMMIQVLSEAMNQVFGPWLFCKMYQNEYNTVTVAQKGYLLMYSFVTVIVLTVSPEIVKIIGSKEYWDGTAIIMWVVFATFLSFTYTLYVNLEFYEKRTELISAGTLSAAVINVLLNFLFLSKFGYRFAAYSTVISYITLLFFHFFIVNYLLKIKIVDNYFVMLDVIIVFGVTLIMYYTRDIIGLRLVAGVLADAFLLAWFSKWYKKNRNVMQDIERL